MTCLSLIYDNMMFIYDITKSFWYITKVWRERAVWELL